MKPSDKKQQKFDDCLAFTVIKIELALGMTVGNIDLPTFAPSNGQPACDFRLRFRLEGKHLKHTLSQI